MHISSYFIGLGQEANVYADGNYIEFADAVTNSFNDGGELTWSDSNIVVETDQAPKATELSFLPSDFYEYELTPAVDVPRLVSEGAGIGVITVP